MRSINGRCRPGGSTTTRRTACLSRSVWRSVTTATNGTTRRCPIRSFSPRPATRSMAPTNRRSLGPAVSHGLHAAVVGHRRDAMGLVKRPKDGQYDRYGDGRYPRREAAAGGDCCSNACEGEHPRPPLPHGGGSFFPIPLARDAIVLNCRRRRGGRTSALTCGRRLAP
jgi:hypothetical protein